jgi:hypothetical protein
MKQGNLLRNLARAGDGSGDVHAQRLVGTRHASEGDVAGRKQSACGLVVVARAMVDVGERSGEWRGCCAGDAAERAQGKTGGLAAGLGRRQGVLGARGLGEAAWGLAGSGASSLSARGGTKGGQRGQVMADGGGRRAACWRSGAARADAQQVVERAGRLVRGDAGRRCADVAWRL